MAYYFFSFRQFWVKEPRHSETDSDGKCYLYRSKRRMKGALQPKTVKKMFRSIVLAKLIVDCPATPS